MTPHNYNLEDSHLTPLESSRSPLGGAELLAALGVAEQRLHHQGGSGYLPEVSAQASSSNLSTRIPENRTIFTPEQLSPSSVVVAYGDNIRRMREQRLGTPTVSQQVSVRPDDLALAA